MRREHTTIGEDAAIDLYCRIHKAKLLERRDRPDGLVQDQNGQIRFIEVRGLYAGEEKQEHKRFATALNTPKAKFTRECPARFFVFNPKDTDSAYWQSIKPSISHAIREKDSNMEYSTWVQKHGKGILVLNLESICETTNCPEGFSVSISCRQFQEIFVHIPPITEYHQGNLKRVSPKLVRVATG